MEMLKDLWEQEPLFMCSGIITLFVTFPLWVIACIVNPELFVFTVGLILACIGLVFLVGLVILLLSVFE